MNDHKRTYTMKQIADSIGIDKTKVWRFIRDNNIREYSKNGRVLLFDEQQRVRIIKGVKSNDVHSMNERKNDSNLSDKELISVLKNELEQKNKEIDKFQKLLDQQQQLNLSSQKLLENQKSEQNVNNHTTQSHQNTSKDDHNDTDTNTNEQNKKPSNGIREGFFKRLFR
ncbi:replication protein B [Lentilactobacillus hilgardii]|uniref:replication protein B n=1 Tax=Lentilactobacillus hilgardii TaxID=1588 RepID=UPI0021C28356|nr:replication protein B [Lentilactobacillus hilgardii]MCP9334127.1 replication protein B [Lentilactobacillus hilgardii]MCP9350747.1 replication protein B [Lentilactobacillus hilgardii]MCP9353604.1 replication protein B [Lentilactobacillus hilgardii]